MTQAIDDLKRTAAEQAVALVKSGQTLGLGTGSTMRFALEALASRLASGALSGIVGIPTSERTAILARSLQIPIASLEERPHIDLAIDGADEIDPQLDLIKGLGGALLREKIVAAAARELVIIADDLKLVPRLGSRAPVPIEIVPFARPLVLDRLARMPGQATLRLDTEGHPYRSDEGHWILDYACGPIPDARALNQQLHEIPGVVDHGLFLGMATRAIVAGGGGIRVVERG